MPAQRDVVPLGASGLVTVPRSRVAVDQAARSAFLHTDEERHAWLAGLIERRLDSPITAPGSGVIARNILQRFPSDPRPRFAEKLLVTLRDGAMHSTLVVSGDDRPVAVCFVSWRGSWQDVAPTRYGQYLNGFVGWIGRLNASSVPVTAFLQIDALIKETVDPADPLRALDDCVKLDVEYSYMPGYVFGREREDATVPRAIVMNPDLLSQEQKAQLKSLLQG